MDIKAYKKKRGLEKAAKRKVRKKWIDKTKAHLTECGDLFERMKMDQSGRILEEVNRWGSENGLAEITKIVRNRDGYCLNEKGGIVLLFSGIQWSERRLRIDPLSDTEFYGIYRIDPQGKEVKIDLPRIDYYGLRELPSVQMIEAINLQGGSNFFHYLNPKDFERCRIVNSHWHDAVVKYRPNFYKTAMIVYKRQMNPISSIASNLFDDQPLNVQWRTRQFNEFPDPPPLPRNRERLVKYLGFIFGCAFKRDPEVTEGVKLSSKSPYFDLMIRALDYWPILVIFPRSQKFFGNWDRHQFYLFNRWDTELARRGYPLKGFLQINFVGVARAANGHKPFPVRSSYSGSDSDSDSDSAWASGPGLFYSKYFC